MLRLYEIGDAGSVVRASDAGTYVIAQNDVSICSVALLTLFVTGM